MIQSNKRFRLSEKINFRRLGDEVKQHDVHLKKLRDAVGIILADDVDLNIRYLVQKPQLLEPLVDAISTLRNTSVLYQLILFLSAIWNKCQKYVEPENLFAVRKLRNDLIRLLTDSEFRTNKTLRISILRCLSEVLEHKKSKQWSMTGDANLCLSVLQDFVETEGSVSNKDDKGIDIVPDQLHITLIKFASVTLVNICRVNVELRTRLARDYGEKMIFLANAALAHNLPDVAANCCLIWHNLCGDDLGTTVYLMRTSVVLEATMDILNKFKGQSEANALARSAALLFISDVSALNTLGKNRLASAKDLLTKVYEILTQEYINVDSLPVLACCKTLARLTHSDECKHELNLLLESTFKSRDCVLLMMVLVRWKDYDNIVRYLLEICDNISLHESLLFRKHILGSFKPTLEEIIFSFGMNDHKIGYAVRKLLIAIDLGGGNPENTQSV